VVWRSARFSAGPPIVGGGAVWTFDQDSGTLLAFDPANGGSAAGSKSVRPPTTPPPPPPVVWS
jgi:hypothetical protein